MKLRVPEGCGGVSFGGREYPVKDGLVEVPDEAAVFLEEGYGCAPVTEPEPKKKEKAKE